MIRRNFMAEEIKEEQQSEEKAWEPFDFKHKGAFKLSNKFKARFQEPIQGQNTIKADGLIVLAHYMGMWKMDTEIIQYPSQENNNTCIAKCTVGGYDWDPSENKIIRVEYTDFADASPTNCAGPVAKSFIRMASTRAQARALRRYTNIDMVCAEELTDDDMKIDFNAVSASNPTKMINQQQFVEMNNIVKSKHISQQQFYDILTKTFNVNNINMLTEDDSNKFIDILKTLIVSGTTETSK